MQVNIYQIELGGKRKHSWRFLWRKRRKYAHKENHLQEGRNGLDALATDQRSYIEPTWHPSKQTFTVGGLKAKEIKAKFSSLLCASLDSKDNMQVCEDSEQLIDESISQEQSQPLPVPCIANDKITTLECAIEEIKSQVINPLAHRAKRGAKTEDPSGRGY